MTDISTDAYLARMAIVEAAATIRCVLTAPHVIHKPALYIDGNKWCALFGENLQEGVAGFGDTPAEAMLAFDAAWNSLRPPPCREVAS